MSKSLCFLPNLVRLSLAFNNLSDTGTVALSKALAQGKSRKLERLSLHNNSIGSRGFFSIIDVDRIALPSLNHFDFQRNELDLMDIERADKTLHDGLNAVTFAITINGGTFYGTGARVRGQIARIRAQTHRKRKRNDAKQDGRND